MSRKIESSSQESRWRQHLQILLPILAVYLVLAFYGIGRQGFWEDEYLSVLRLTSRHPIWKDGHGFLYFALLSLWSQLGTSEVVLRTLSVLLGALAVCLTYAIGITLIDRRAALFGTVIFATSPFFIWYSQEVRYITLMLVTTLAMMYTFHRVVFRGTVGWWVGYGTATLLSLFAFLSTLLLPLAQGLFLWGSPSRRALLKKWLVCQFVVFSFFTLWFVHGTHFLNAIAEARGNGEQIRSNPKVFPFTGDFNNVRPEVIPYTFFAFSAGFSLGPSPRDLYADRSLAPLERYLPTLVFLVVFYAAVLLSGWLAFRQRRDSRNILLLWIAVPIMGVFGIAKLLDIFYDVRYVAMVLPAYVLFLAAGIVRFRKVGVQVLLLGAVLAIHGVALANYYFDPRYAREDTRSAARFLESKATPHDLALVVGTVSSLPYYYKRPISSVRPEFLKGSDPSLRQPLRELAGSHNRLWLVQIRPWQTDRKGTVQAALDETYELMEKKKFPGVDIRGYRLAQ